MRKTYLFLLVLLFPGLLALSLAAWEAPVVNDGKAHGDPPYLLEPGWTALINGKNLDGWRFEHPDHGTWTTSPGIFWDSANQPHQLMALPGPGNRLSNGPKGGVTNIVTDPQVRRY